jgi:tetratricopeptide (TPR) repeat protein
MWRFLSKGVWTCPLGAPEQDTITRRFVALVVVGARAARRRPLRALAVLGLLMLVAGAGFYVYVLGRTEAARVALKEGRTEDARRDLDLRLRVWPRTAAVHLLAARAARLRGDFAVAEEHLQECLRLQNGATPETQLEFLLMRVQMGEVDQVAEQLQVYIDNQHPETVTILETLAGVYLHNFRYGPALKTLDHWIQVEPNSAKAHYWRGLVMERLNDRNGAIEDYLRALDLAPELIEARLRLADMYLEQSDPLDALPHLERLYKQFPNRADVQSGLGRCKFLQAQPQEARPLLEAAVAQRPDDTMLLVHLAKLELQQDRPVEAENWLQRSLKIDPYDVEAEHVLAESLRLQGRRKEAAEVQEQYEKNRELLKQIDILLRSETAHPSSGPAIPCEIGVLFLRIGQERTGLNWLHRALDRDDGYRPAHEALVDYFEKKGDKEKALAHRRRLAGPGRSGGDGPRTQGQ